MNIDVSALFAPFRVAGLELKNRFVMAPMTRTRSPGGVPTPEVAAYYRRRAEGTTEGIPSCVAKRVTRPVRNREAAVPDRA